MESYTLTKKLGEGAYGSVRQAIHKQSGEVVAIKRMKRKYGSWQECLDLREVKSLQKLVHPNIVLLKELFHQYGNLYFVFEYLEQNLYQVIAGRKNPSAETEVRNLCRQVFQGLAYMHRKGYFHRDLKPENLLVSGNTVKIADFGMAREINSKPPYTQYVGTRWYRAPEVMLQSDFHSSEVDMWAIGAIMAELFTLRPLFPGASEADQMYRICSVLGSPTMDSWADGIRLARNINYQFPQFDGVQLSASIPTASEEAVDLISKLCSWNPCHRPSAAEALMHPFFGSDFYIPPAIWFCAAAPKGAIVAARTGEEFEQKYDQRSNEAFNSSIHCKFPYPLSCSAV